MSTDYDQGMMDALDGNVDTRRMEYWPDYAAGVREVMDIRAKLDSGEYHPADIRFCIDPGVTGDPRPWDAKAYRAGYQDAQNRRPYRSGQRHEYGTGYSNRLLEEAFRATDTGAAQMTDECLGKWEQEEDRCG